MQAHNPHQGIETLMNRWLTDQCLTGIKSILYLLNLSALSEGCDFFSIHVFVHMMTDI